MEWMHLWVCFSFINWSYHCFFVYSAIISPTSLEKLFSIGKPRGQYLSSFTNLNLPKLSKVNALAEFTSNWLKEYIYIIYIYTSKLRCESRSCFLRSTNSSFILSSLRLWCCMDSRSLSYLLCNSVNDFSTCCKSSEYWSLSDLSDWTWWCVDVSKPDSFACSCNSKHKLWEQKLLWCLWVYRLQSFIRCKYILKLSLIGVVLACKPTEVRQVNNLGTQGSVNNFK